MIFYILIHTFWVNSPLHWRHSVQKAPAETYHLFLYNLYFSVYLDLEMESMASSCDKLLEYTNGRLECRRGDLSLFDDFRRIHTWPMQLDLTY